jgi:hypothetical protein
MFMAEMPRESATLMTRKAKDYLIDFPQFVSQ